MNVVKKEVVVRGGEEEEETREQPGRVLPGLDEEEEDDEGLGFRAPRVLSMQYDESRLIMGRRDGSLVELSFDQVARPNGTLVLDEDEVEERRRHSLAATEVRCVCG